MFVRLVGNIVTEGDSKYFCVVGCWDNEENAYVNVIGSCANKKAKLSEQFRITAKDERKNVTPWMLWSFDCGDQDKDINDYRKLIQINDAKPVVYKGNFWKERSIGVFVEFDEVKKYLDEIHLNDTYLIKTLNDGCVYGLFNCKRDSLRKYSIDKNRIFVYKDRTNNMEYRFIREKDLKDSCEDVDCSGKEQLKKWFTDDYVLNARKYICGESELKGLDGVRWDRVKFEMKNFVLQDEALIKLFENTQESGFGKMIVNAARKTIEEDYKKELENNNDFYLKRKKEIEDEIKRLEENKNIKEKEIEQYGREKRVEIDNEIRKWDEMKRDHQNACIEVRKERDRIKNEISDFKKQKEEFDKQKKEFEEEQTRFEKEKNQKVNSLEKALQNVKEKYSDLIDDLKVIIEKKEDAGVHLYPPYEINSTGKYPWKALPKFSKIETIKEVYDYGKMYGPCRIYVMHVEHDWLHYSDFVNHGLLKIWQMASEKTEMLYILVLDCLNLTRPECGMQPLLDSIESNEIPLLGTNLTRPDNLKIVATLLPKEDEGGIGQDISAIIKRLEC